MKDVQAYVGVGLLVFLDYASPCQNHATGSDCEVIDTGVGYL